MLDLKSLTLDELKIAIEALGEKPFRAKQIYEWIHIHKVASFDEMTNLSKAFRDKLKAEATLTTLEKIDCQISAIDGTRKYLFALADGNVVESVFMRYKHGNSVCVSSQVGCRMGCVFCASTLDGLERNLTPAEMLDQVYSITRDTGERVSNLVIMGTGEPLDNYDNAIKFIRLLSDEAGNNMSQRNITLSTCGIVPQIEKLAQEDLQITLALSLHATTQEKRLELMPIAKAYAIDEAIGAMKSYYEKTGRRITFEYSLVAGVNDSTEDAKALASLIRGINCHVNLIPVNPIKERDFAQPNTSASQAFLHCLEKQGINATIRREMGRDIDGACGQLRRKHKLTTQRKGD